MTNNESVVGHHWVYYDNYDNQTLIASDSEEEDIGDDNDKHKPKHVFTKGEDSLIWYIFSTNAQECSLSKWTTILCIYIVLQNHPFFSMFIERFGYRAGIGHVHYRA